MHVAFVATPDLSYVSGSSLSLRYTVEALGRRGVACTVLCQYAPKAAPTPNVRYVELPMPLDYQVITDSTPSSSDLSACLTMLTNELAGLPGVDVVHAIYGTFTGVAAALAGALARVPVAITTFGRDVILGAEVDDRYRRLMKIAYGYADLVIASDDTVSELVARDYAPRARHRVLPPGVNFALLRGVGQAASPRSPGKRILTVHSSFNQAKGLGVLVDAYALLRAQIPEAELIVVGHDDTPEKHIEAAIRRQIRERGVEDGVRFLGHLTHEKVAETMTTCDVLVDPRVINSFSSCVYEAMTLNLPVVASDRACNRDALAEGERGVLTRTGDPEDLARGIVSVLRDPTEATELRTAAAKHIDKAETEYGADVVAEALHGMYTELTGTVSR